jgi:hypothetical protein
MSQLELLTLQGAWARHQFDITTRRQHGGSTKDEEWTDISEEGGDGYN